MISAIGQSCLLSNSKFKTNLVTEVLSHCLTVSGVESKMDGTAMAISLRMEHSRGHVELRSRRFQLLIRLCS